MSTAGAIIAFVGLLIVLFWAVVAWLSNDRGTAIIVGFGGCPLFIVMILVSLGVMT